MSFRGRQDLGAFHTGVDLVALTNEGDYWAIQCKCYQERTIIRKKKSNSSIRKATLVNAPITC